MLPSLRHHAFIGGHNQHRQVDPPDSGQHVFDEPLMPRHIYDAHLPAAGQRQPREPQVNRHLPFLLLREAVGINVGKSLD